MKPILFFLIFLLVVQSNYSQVPLTNATYTQDFNTLAATGTSSTVPTGWLFTETGSNANSTYTAGTGTGNAGDTYSFGIDASDRAFGGLLSGSLNPTLGAGFMNNTGGTITALSIAYTGEQWRLGASPRPAADTLNFQYSTNATSLTTGTWTDVNNLDFFSPVTTGTVGALVGNNAANRTAISFTITGLSIPAGAVFYLRWLDFNITSSDDGLSIDDFSITPTSTGGSSLSINDVSKTEGNGGNTSFDFTVSLSAPAPAGGVTFDIATQNNSAMEPADYTSNSLVGQTIPEGATTYTFSVMVLGDLTVEPDESFFVNITNLTGTGVSIGDGQGLGTIINDDCAPTHTIHEIQGNGNTTPYLGSLVTIAGTVTGVKGNGFFLQAPDVAIDADPGTSEGIFVFTSGIPPVTAVSGNNLCISGTVGEFIPAADPNSPSQTELLSITQVIVQSTGNPLPTPILLTSANTNPAGSIYQLEKYEGMRVQVASLTAVAPTGGSVSEPSATATSNGYFYGVITGQNRPFREPGIQTPDPLPQPGIPVFDANPELIGVASKGLFGGTAIDVATGAILTNVTGPLDYTNRTYTINVDLGSTPVVSNNNLTFTAVPVQNANELTVASFNMERFFDNINDPNIGEPILSSLAYNNRLKKVTLAIKNVLNTPDVIGAIEIENVEVLQTIANNVNAAAGTDYVAYLLEGNDVGGIDVGFLVKASRVNVQSVVQYGKDATYIDPNNGQPTLLNDRPPLVLTGSFNQPGCAAPYPFKVIVNHLRSLNGNDDPIDGNRVRTKRRSQAEFLAQLIQDFQNDDPDVHILSIGDYNAFQFNDGYGDLIGTIKGMPTPATNVVLTSPDLVNPDLVDLVDNHVPAQRYSYSFEGNAQVLDHILVNQNVFNKISRFSVARLDADFPEIYRNDPNRPERVSDHDAPVAYVLFTQSCSITATPENNVYTGGVATNIYLGYGPQKVTLTSTMVEGGPFTYAWTGSFLSCTDCAAPVFAPTLPGTYSINVLITTSFGCSTTCSITICVMDIRVPGADKKVFLCHTPDGNLSNPQTLQVNTSAVQGHLANHGSDKLGRCDQTPCGTSGLITAGYPKLESTVIDRSFSATIYPNPGISDFSIKVHSASEAPMTIKISDLYGRIITERNGISDKVTRFGANLSAGLYTITITQGQEKQVLKWMKL